MDVNKLINLVYEKKPIWDQTCTDHHNRYTLEKCWKEVGNEFPGTDIKIIKAKWKNLRDCFRKKLAGISQEKPSGDAGGEFPKEESWPYFGPLSFLREQFTPRESTGNLRSQIAVEIPSDLEESSSCPSPVSTVSERRERKKHGLQRVGEQLLEAEEKKIKLIKEKMEQKQTKCDDMRFFESLIPYVKKIPETAKLKFRNDMQTLVQNYAFENQMEIVYVENGEQEDCM